MTVLRLFKGYRESEVAWVAVDRASSPERGADGARVGAGESGGGRWTPTARGRQTGALVLTTRTMQQQDSGRRTGSAC